MKPTACRALRTKLQSNEPAFGLWVTLDSPAVTEMAVGLGMDWVVIDAEHGHLDWKEIAEHLRATVRSETVALVRLAELNVGAIKRSLDIGADGVVIPWVGTAEQLRDAVRFAKYPLDGVRGVGGERATAWGHALAEHAAEANDHVFVVPILETVKARENRHHEDMIVGFVVPILETVKARENLPAMLAVPGVDLFWFGPADYSASAGFRGQWEGPGVAEQLLEMKDAIRAAGKHCGVVATSDLDVQQRLEQGFRALALGMDAGLMLRSLKTSLAAVGRDRKLSADLLARRASEGIESEAAEDPRWRVGLTSFRVALTGDFHDSAGKPKYSDIGLSLFEGTGVAVHSFPEHQPEIAAEQLGDANGVIVLTPRVTAASLAKSENLLAVGRFGVGYDTVDLAACTAADVLLFIAAGAVDRPVAEATVAWMLALSHHVHTKDRLVRESRWDDRSQFMGTELRDRTLGVVGFGGIGKALVKLLAGFGMKPPLVFDPFVTQADAIHHGVSLVPLDRLLRESDFVSVHCPLTDQTRNLIGEGELHLMKPTAYLLNTARGGIVNEAALEAALRSKRIAGAAIDCFEKEPLAGPPAFALMHNVLSAPHCIAWTEELFRDIGRTVCSGMLDLASGRVPHGVVNREVLEKPGFQEKWRRIRGQG